MNQLDASKQAQVIAALCEGNSIRLITRMFNVGKNTVARLIVDAGEACGVFQNEALRNLRCKRVQCDEIWAFVGAKDKNLPGDKQGKSGFGSVWTWTAIDADSKLICSWMVGDRSAKAAAAFMEDLAGRMANRIQLTTDGYNVYADAVEGAFGSDIDYGMLVKVYGESSAPEKRYTPADCIGCQRKKITGDPDAKHISTSYVERQNLTMMMHMRRFTRLTNGFSKKIENHISAVSLHFMYYNFVKIHGTLHCTPAMAAGASSRLWDVADIVALTEQYREERIKREREDRSERGFSPFGDALGGKGLK